MLNGKVHTVTAPDLVTTVNRNSKILALKPFHRLDSEADGRP